MIDGLFNKSICACVQIHPTDPRRSSNKRAKNMSVQMLSNLSSSDTRLFPRNAAGGSRRKLGT